MKSREMTQSDTLAGDALDRASEISAPKHLKVYRYALHAPHEGAEIVRNQMLAAHRYRNTLVEIERGRRAAVRALLVENGVAELTATAERAKQRVIELHRAIDTERLHTRRRSETADMRSALAALRAAHRDAARALREARLSLREDPAISAEMKIIAMRATELQHSARAHCGVYWGTYLLVEDAVQAMAKAPMYEDDAVTPHDPSFTPWTGYGVVSVQLQRKRALKDATSGKHPQLFVRLPGESAWYSERRGTRRRLRAC